MNEESHHTALNKRNTLKLTEVQHGQMNQAQIQIMERIREIDQLNKNNPNQ